MALATVKPHYCIKNQEPSTGPGGLTEYNRSVLHPQINSSLATVRRLDKVSIPLVKFPFKLLKTYIKV